MHAPGFGETLTLNNPDQDPESRIGVVSLPLPLDGPPCRGLGDLPTQTQTIGWWPRSQAGRPGVARRQLMFAVSPQALPSELPVTDQAGASIGEWSGPQVSCQIVNKKNTGIILNEVNELAFSYQGLKLGLRMGLIHQDEYRWWEWVKVEELWGGPLCRAFRAGGFIPVHLFDDDYAASFQHQKECRAVHFHNWLRGEIFILVFTNGVIQLTCRHINNHFFDHGRDLEDVLPVIGFNPPGAEDLPGILDGTTTRFSLGGAALNLDQACEMVCPEHPGRLEMESDLVIYQPYEGVEITGDNHHRVRDDGYIVKAEDRLFPKGVARTLQFNLSLGPVAPVISRFTVPAWWYAQARDLWGDQVLPVRDDCDRLLESAQRYVISQTKKKLRCFDSAVLTREVWEGEIPYSQMLYYYLSGDPIFFKVALNDSYHIADIGFDHATETMRMHNFPFGSIANPLYRTVAMTYAWLETGDPYLLDCSESAATRYYWIDRHNWPRRSYGRDAASLRSLIFLWDYTGKEDYLTMAREGMERNISCQRPDGSYGDQGGAVGACGGSANEITKPWMAMMANDPVIDYLLRRPGDRTLEKALIKTADFMLNTQLEVDGQYYWAYQYGYGDNPGDPHEMRHNPERFNRFPSSRQRPHAPGYWARFLPFATLLTGDRRYLEAWQRFVQSYWSKEENSPGDVGYTSNKIVQYVPFAQAHLWNARRHRDGLHISPVMTSLTPTIEGTILTPFGPLWIKCRRQADELTVTTRADRPFPITLRLNGSSGREVTIKSTDEQTFIPKPQSEPEKQPA